MYKLIRFIKKWKFVLLVLVVVLFFVVLSLGYDKLTELLNNSVYEFITNLF